MQTESPLAASTSMDVDPHRWHLGAEEADTEDTEDTEPEGEEALAAPASPELGINALDKDIVKVRKELSSDWRTLVFNGHVLKEAWTVPEVFAFLFSFVYCELRQGCQTSEKKSSQI